MSAVAETLVEQLAPANRLLPVIIVGAGPVGIRAAQALLRRDPQTPLLLFGDEPWQPYNRVRLSSLLAGDVDWGELENALEIPGEANVRLVYHCAIRQIDPTAHCVTDASGEVYPYSRLILATGSRPHVPAIPGIDKKGVFTFRDMNDVQELLARQTRSRRTVVLGAGLLGLEAARAMQRRHTEVVVIEHSNRVLPQQLDAAGAELLRERLMGLGMTLLLADGVQCVTGTDHVDGVQLRSGRHVACDTLVVATGIRPNIDLALDAGLSVGRGIRVDDRMRTSDEHIYAVGECAEHRERVYGIVAPGFEQAEIAAHCVLGGDSYYKGSIAATRLKVVGQTVFNMGRIGEEENPLDLRFLHFHQPQSDRYRKLTLRRGCLVGAMAVGEWDQLGRVQEGIIQSRRIWPWQRRRFLATGKLWLDTESQNVAQWPASATVCNCTGVTRGELSKLVGEGLTTVEALKKRSGASSVCGSCQPLLAQLVGSSEPVKAVRGYRVLIFSAVVALLVSLAFLLSPPVPFATSADVPWQWDKLWRSSLFKQISGYSVLGLSVLLLSLSLRKRWRRITFFDFPIWRVLHVALGVLGLLALFAHTGLRLGHNLNLYLMLSFVGLIGIGTVTAGVIALEHRLDTTLARRLRETSLWMHILLFWPLPVLLGFHIIKTYYF
jgi:nitrite reductase (NADH) large subunit